jgi:predicted nucleic acid-binding protein
MTIFDTTVWIEHLRSNQNFFQKTTQLLESREVLAVECVFGELLQGVKNKYEEELILNYWEHLPKVNYEAIMIEAGIYSSENKLIDKGVGLIDTVILLSAIKSDSKIWTLDTKFLKIIPEELLYKDIMV